MGKFRGLRWKEVAQSETFGVIYVRKPGTDELMILQWQDDTDEWRNVPAELQGGGCYGNE